MKKLNWDLKQMTQRNRDGSHATQAARWRALDLMGRQLHQLGFTNMRKESLKPRHIEALVNEWQRQGLAIGTIKNRLAHVRWWAEHIGNPSIIPNDNIAIGVANRCYVTNESKAQVLDERLALVTDPYVRMSLELQAQFGLRREEAMKIQPTIADRGDKLFLQDSWTKGRRAREIPIRTEEQRDALARAHQLAGKGSLIPPDKRYIDQLRVYERTTQAAGLHKMHGLRHAYAQRCYQEFTGWACPALGGPIAPELTPEQRPFDHAARLQISAELGHEREQITAIYLGR